MIYNPAYTYKFQLKTTLITWWAHAKWYVHVLSINLYRNSYRKVQIHIRFMIDWGPPNLCQQMCHTVILWYNIYVSKVMIQLLCIFLASTKKKHCFMTLYWLWTLTKCFPQKLKLKGALVNIIRYEEKKKSYPNYTHLGSNGFQLV